MLSENGKIDPGEKVRSLPRLDEPVNVRIRFCKKGNLQFISHLDLQRTFHRVLVRANIPMWYTQGFNPHAKLVFGLPLSVGCESECELADLRIDRKISLESIKNQLNEQLTDEMYVIEAYYASTKFADIAFAEYTITLKSPKIDEKSGKTVTDLFSKPVLMTKKTKSGEKEVDISGYINKMTVRSFCGGMEINLFLPAGNTESLNPEYVVSAIKEKTGLFSADPHCESYTVVRNNIYDRFMVEFK